MLRKRLIFTFTLTVLISSVFSQTNNEETINEYGIPNKYYPDYYHVNFNLVDSFSNVLKLKPIIDSIKNINLKADYNSTSDLVTICVLLDSLSIDTLTFNKIKITLKNETKQIRRNYDLTLKQNFKISIYNFPLNLYEHSLILSAPNKKANLIYEREEIHDIINLSVIDKFIDKQKQLWFKISLMVKKIEPSINKKPEEYESFENYNGWVKAGSIHIGYCN